MIVTWIVTLGILIAPELEKIGFKRNTLSLHSSDKAVTSPEVFKVRFYKLCDRLKKFYHLY